MAATAPACRAVVAARAQSQKLAEWSGGMRYTCPSYEIEGLSVGADGFWSLTD